MWLWTASFFLKTENTEIPWSLDRFLQRKLFVFASAGHQNFELRFVGLSIMQVTLYKIYLPLSYLSVNVRKGNSSPYNSLGTTHRYNFTLILEYGLSGPVPKGKPHILEVSSSPKNNNHMGLNIPPKSWHFGPKYPYFLVTSSMYSVRCYSICQSRFIIVWRRICQGTFIQQYY